MKHFTLIRCPLLPSEISVLNNLIRFINLPFDYFLLDNLSDELFRSVLNEVKNKHITYG